MNNEWGGLGNPDDYRWLNFSTPKYTHNGKWSTAQDRMYGASGLETISRPLTQDPPLSYKYEALPRRPEYPELAALKPSEVDEPKVDHLGSGCEIQGDHLNIVWREPDPNPSAPQAAGEIQALAYNYSGTTVTYPNPAVITARVFKHLPITRAQVSATYTGPDGVSHTLAFTDDGVSPDAEAEDGLYSAILPYDRDGAYNVSVTFSNPSLAAVYTELGYLHAAAAQEYEETFPPVGEAFSQPAALTFNVKDYRTDDYGDSEGTAAYFDSERAEFAGRIDRPGDEDWFIYTPQFSGMVAIRVDHVALGAQPRLRIYGEDGTLRFDEDQLQPSGGGYFMTPVHVNYWGRFLIVVSDANPAASGGLYRLSTGPLLNNALEMSRVTHLPLVVR